MDNRKFYLVAGILAIVGILGVANYFPSQTELPLTGKIFEFPKTIGEWISQDMPLSEKTYKLLGTKNIIMRNYENNSGDIINLYVVYSVNNRCVSYPPEISLEGKDKTITTKSNVAIAKSIKAVKLTVETEKSRELLVYWFRANSFNTDSYIKQQVRVSIDKMLRRNFSVSLISVMIEIKENGEVAAFDRIKSFCELIEPLLNQYFS